MFQALRTRLDRDERGFTLIELMVVVLIIAILIAIAIPTFLGARTKAQDRAAQVDLRQGLLTAKSHYTDNESYNATAAELSDVEPTLTFDETVGNADKTTIGFTGTDDDLVMVKQSKSGKFFCIAETVSGGTTYDSDDDATAIDSVTECDQAEW